MTPTDPAGSTQTLADVISQVEDSDKNYQTAVSKTGTDLSAAAAVQAKLDAANALVVQDKSDQSSAAVAKQVALLSAVAFFQAQIDALNADIQVQPPAPVTPPTA